MARPKKVTQSVMDEICDRMANGAYLKDICADLGVDRSNVYRATKADEDFGLNYDRACTFAVDAQLEDAATLLREAVTRDEIYKADKLVNAAQWKAEKRSKQYQPTQKSEVAHVGPMLIGWDTKPMALADEPFMPDDVLDHITRDDVAN